MHKNQEENRFSKQVIIFQIYFGDMIKIIPSLIGVVNRFQKLVRIILDALEITIFNNDSRSKKKHPIEQGLTEGRRSMAVAEDL